jgi:hypothetical protein
MSTPDKRVKGIAKCQPARSGRTYVWVLDAGATEPRYNGIAATTIAVGATIAGYQVVNAREFQQVLRANRAAKPV